MSRKLESYEIPVVHNAPFNIRRWLSFSQRNENAIVCRQTIGNASVRVVGALIRLNFCTFCVFRRRAKARLLVKVRRFPFWFLEQQPYVKWNVTSKLNYPSVMTLIYRLMVWPRGFPAYQKPQENLIRFFALFSISFCFSNPFADSFFLCRLRVCCVALVWLVSHFAMRPTCNWLLPRIHFGETERFACPKVAFANINWSPFDVCSVSSIESNVILGRSWFYSMLSRSLPLSIPT